MQPHFASFTEVRKCYNCETSKNISRYRRSWCTVLYNFVICKTQGTKPMVAWPAWDAVEAVPLLWSVQGRNLEVVREAYCSVRPHTKSRRNFGKAFGRFKSVSGRCRLHSAIVEFSQLLNKHSGVKAWPSVSPIKMASLDESRVFHI